MPVYKFTGTYRVEFWEEEIEADNQEDAERELECRAEQRLELEEPLQVEVVEDDGAGEETLASEDEEEGEDIGFAEDDAERRLRELGHKPSNDA
jgi:hypothetical protein